jgi:Fe2+ transport system protein FeoA
MKPSARTKDHSMKSHPEIAVDASGLNAGGSGSRRISLATLRAGQRGRVDFSEYCDDCDLLNAMGLTHQCRLRVCKAGAPCIVQIGSTRLGLAPVVAQRISIVPE